MYTNVDGLSGEAKSKQERSIEVEFQVSKKKAAGQKAIIDAKAETEGLGAINSSQHQFMALAPGTIGGCPFITHTPTT